MVKGFAPIQGLNNPHFVLVFPIILSQNNSVQLISNSILLNVLENNIFHVVPYVARGSVSLDLTITYSITSPIYQLTFSFTKYCLS